MKDLDGSVFTISCKYSEEGTGFSLETDMNKEPNKQQAQAIINALLQFAGNVYRIDFN